MKEVHDFSTPRNLYEKLLRDSERLDSEVSGDNLFNFMATAYRLQAWIKKSPMAQHETIKRLLRKASRNPLMQNCNAILEGKKHFSLERDDDYPHPVLIIEEEKFNPTDFKNELKEIFDSYFHQK